MFENPDYERSSQSEGRDPERGQDRGRGQGPRRGSKKSTYRQTSRGSRGGTQYSPRRPGGRIIVRRIVVLENPKAGSYKENSVTKLIGGLEANGFEVERICPDSARQLADEAESRVRRRPYALIAAGGDGTANLVSRALISSQVRLGILPLGKFNNIFRSLIGKPSVALALAAINNGATRRIDHGVVAGQPFLGSISLGLIPRLTEELTNRSCPIMGFGWSRLANRVAENLERPRLGIKVDSFRFDIEPFLVSIHLMPYSVGLPFAPSAVPDDGKFEALLDMSANGDIVGKFVSGIYRRKYFFEGEVRLFRGEQISIGPVKGRTLYLDGELIKIPTNTVDVTLVSRKINVCVLK